MVDALDTRQKILMIAADEIHHNGFQATSLSTILNRCEISKGALYHHFSSKLALGYAVFEEVYVPQFLDNWQPYLADNDPIEGLCRFFTHLCETMVCSEAVCGCPLNNLCEEMANVDEGFRLRILAMQEKLNAMIVAAFARIQDQLRINLQHQQVAYFIVATLHGSTALSKSSRNKVLFQQVLNELCLYVRALKK